MITLTTDLSLEVLLAAAPTTQCDVCSSFADMSDDIYAPSENRTQTNGLHAVEAVPSGKDPSVKRLVDFFSVYNPNAAAVTVTVRIRDKTKAGKTGEYIIILSKSVPAGETLQYVHGSGFMSSTRPAELWI